MPQADDRGPAHLEEVFINELIIFKSSRALQQKLEIQQV
jgi:hypothetical protein